MIIRSSCQPRGIHPNPSLGWKTCLTGRVTTAEIPGYEFSLFVKPKVQLLAMEISQHLPNSGDKNVIPVN